MPMTCFSWGSHQAGTVAKATVRAVRAIVMKKCFIVGKN